MNRFILALVAVALLAAPAEAGRRCYRSYQTIYSLNGWNHSCYSCHAQKKPRSDKDLLSGLASKLSGDAQWYGEFHSLTGKYAQQGGVYAAAGVPGGYQTTVAGQYSSYPVQGQSLYGVQQAYSNHSLLDLNAAAGTLGKVVEQTAAGSQNLISGYGNFTATAYALDSQRQENVAAYQAILGVRQGPVTQAKAEVFKYQSTTEPAPQAAAGPPQQAPQQQQHPGLVVLSQRCAACHSPNGQHGVQGTFDLSRLDLKMVQAAADRVSLPVDDPKRMPLGEKTEAGFSPGPALPWNELRAIQDLALGVQ